MVRDGQQTGVLTKKLLKVEPWLSMNCLVKARGVIPPSTKSWSSVSSRIMLLCLHQQELQRSSCETIKLYTNFIFVLSAGELCHCTCVYPATPLSIVGVAYLHCNAWRSVISCSITVHAQSRFSGFIINYEQCVNKES